MDKWGAQVARITDAATKANKKKKDQEARDKKAKEDFEKKQKEE